jgi:hypothetical protein
LVLDPAPVPVPEPDYFAQFFNNKIQNTKVQNLAFSMLEVALFLPERCPLIFDFLTFVLHVLLDPGPNPEPDP